ncbi:hypothetical protein SAMN02910447_00470 [Ruminococcus sp. YE71]|uniref:hypothetical protein n=1 Tax=unclassified Ruminococcus TaxID=2608920 RepID=UPI0008891684|nr:MULTISPECIES: hypothetical protein [unclassified Ruminococcus]SDA11756.1 hypothetical protein SAMN02910446_00469 [Ruminococcus sp. YE78]SFW15701.1 hypothetical protein SAMN02910447_00470 [Ruminococcus sp. YE71]
MDIIGTWKVGEFTDPDGKRTDPKDGEDVMMLFSRIYFGEGGEVLLMMPLDREFSGEELELFDEETYEGLEEQGLYDKRFADKLIIERGEWFEQGGKFSVRAEDDESILATPDAESTVLRFDGESILLYNDVKLVKAE